MFSTLRLREFRIKNSFANKQPVIDSRHIGRAWQGCEMAKYSAINSYFIGLSPISTQAKGGYRNSLDYANARYKCSWKAGIQCRT